jgi:hypothetical protein
MKALFPLVQAAVARVVEPTKALRWITFGHYEAEKAAR